MPPYKLYAVISLFSVICLTANAQYTDTAGDTISKAAPNALHYFSHAQKEKNSFPIRSFIVPSAMIAYGFTALWNQGLKDLNEEFKEEVYTEHPHGTVSVDNYLQYAPAAAVYALNAIGVKGEHAFRDRTMIYAISNVILAGTVSTIKQTTAIQRPDGSAHTSFPSGHTAEAFASAEFLRMEYKATSPWYGIAGYAVAVTTGYLRMYNDKHWFSDVVAGAGIGIASTRLAYWLYPKIQHKLFKDKTPHTLWIPTYHNGSLGLEMVHRI